MIKLRKIPMCKKFRILIYKDRAKQWRWSLVSTNGKIVANCGEGYKHRGDALRTLGNILMAKWELKMEWINGQR